MSRMSKRERLKAEISRKHIRQMMDRGFSVSMIAKELGKSYVYVKMIVAQERAAKEQEE